MRFFRVIGALCVANKTKQKNTRRRKTRKAQEEDIKFLLPFRAVGEAGGNVAVVQNGKIAPQKNGNEMRGLTS